MVEPATTAATTAPREPRPSFRALRAIGAQPMHFKGLGLGVKAQFTRGLVQQIDHLLVFQFHRVVATVANQEWHRMLRGAWMMATNIGIARFGFVESEERRVG